MLKAAGQAVFKKGVAGRLPRDLDLIDSEVRVQVVLKVEILHIICCRIRVPLDIDVIGCKENSRVLEPKKEL